MAKPPDRSVKAPAETSRVTTAKPAGKEVRRKNKRNAIAPPPPTAVTPPLTAAITPPTTIEPPPTTIEPPPTTIEPPPTTIEPPPDDVELPLGANEPPPTAIEPSPMLAESPPPDAIAPPWMVDESMPDDVEPSPEANEPSPMLAEPLPPEPVEPPPMHLESMPADAGESPAAEGTQAVAEHAHEVLVRLSDEEHAALAAACAALAAVGQMVSIEDMVRTLVERWMAATRTATAPDVPAPAHPGMLDAVRAQLRWLVAQPLRRWRELRLALRRWTRALAA